MKISILVPTLGNREQEINRLLESLDRQSYKKIEVIVIMQGNYEKMQTLISKYVNLDLKQIRMTVKGLSKARNKGLEVASGEIIALSDDDCWYPENAFETIVRTFQEQKSAKVILSQIYDPEQNVMYKKYNSKEKFIKYRLQLMSRSSIEIAFKKNAVKCPEFNEHLGLGSEFVCGEEVDFLLNNYEKKGIFYKPIVTVYHKKKQGVSSNQQVIAKGAVYGKNYNIFICLLVLMRDLLLKKENNFKYFFEGYNEYIKREN